MYADAKRSSVDESIFGPSSLTSSNVIPVQRNYDFERAKQKFDRPTTSSSSSRNPKKARNFSSFLKFNNKRADPSPVENESYSSLRNSQYLDGDSGVGINSGKVDAKMHNNENVLARKKNDAYMHSSINLDGFKVSEDDDDVSKGGKLRNSQFVWTFDVFRYDFPAAMNFRLAAIS